MKLTEQMNSEKSEMQEMKEIPNHEKNTNQLNWKEFEKELNKSLPCGAGIYCWVESGVPKYVGATHDFRKSIPDHFSASDLVFDGIPVRSSPSKWSVLFITIHWFVCFVV